MTMVALGLGSNIDAEQNLRLGVRELRRRFSVLRISAVYRSAAVGFAGPDFLNLALTLETAAEAVAIQRQLGEIQQLAGRERGGERYGSRTLDIDLLLVDQLCSEELRLPRADVLEYGFVLKPLSEIAPELVHPLSGRTLAEHWREFDAGRHPLTITDVIL